MNICSYNSTQEQTDLFTTFKSGKKKDEEQEKQRKSEVDK